MHCNRLLLSVTADGVVKGETVAPAVMRPTRPAWIQTPNRRVTLAGISAKLRYSPVHERLQGDHELAASAGQLVAHLDRRGRDHGPYHEALGLEFFQPLRQQTIRQPVDEGQDLAEAPGAAGQGEQDRAGPAPADQFDGLLEAPALLLVED